MGSVIDRSAAAEDIVRDASKTLADGKARSEATGDPRWWSMAQARVGRHLALYADRQAALAVVDADVERLRAVVKQVDDASDAAVTVVREKVWNEAGRPGPNADPDLEMLFPDGSDTYVEETIEGSGDALEFLGELLVAPGHPKVPAAVLAELSTVVLTHAERHRSAVGELKKPLARQKLLGKASTVIAKSLRLQLVKLKRAYELEGFSESDIHTVIPDRSKSPAPAAPVTPKPVG